MRRSRFATAPADASRYMRRDYESRDISSDSTEFADLEVAALNARLQRDSDPGEDFARLPLAHVVECRADNRVVLDDGFIPTVMRSAAAPVLATFLAELQGLLHQRGEVLAGARRRERPGRRRGDRGFPDAAIGESLRAGGRPSRCERKLPSGGPVPPGARDRR